MKFAISSTSAISDGTIVALKMWAGLMEKLFSTEDVPPRDRFASWHEIACRTILQHDSRPQGRPAFRAALERGTLADVALLTFKNSPMSFARDRKIIARATGDEFLICLQLRGTMAIEQNGREALLEAGDFTIIDPLLPYAGAFPNASSMLLLKVPRLTLTEYLGKKTPEIIARSSKSSHAPSAEAFSHLTMLTRAKAQSSDAADILDQALKLVALSFSATNNIPHRVEVDAKHAANADVSQWSNADLFFLIDSVRHGRPFLEIAGFLGIDEAYVRLKVRELKLDR